MAAPFEACNFHFPFGTDPIESDYFVRLFLRRPGKMETKNAATWMITGQTILPGHLS